MAFGGSDGGPADDGEGDDRAPDSDAGSGDAGSDDGTPETVRDDTDRAGSGTGPAADDSDRGIDAERTAGEGSADGDGGDEGDEDGVWRFALDEVDEEGIVRPTIEPGNPDPENVLFVVLGAIAMVLVFLRLWLLMG